MSEWIKVSERLPDVGVECLFYRPLAEQTGDIVISIKTAKKDKVECWPQTVPKGEKPCNPSSGFCHVTHWMPIPASPEEE